jgi:hypothetical protein
MWNRISVAMLLLSLTMSAEERETRTISLSSLRAGCAIETRWFGLWPRLPEGAMLRCGTSEFLLLSPSNLLGHVSISSPEAALEFVRLFTSPDTYRLFELGGMVELVPGEVREDSGFNVVDPKIFAKRLKAATIRQIKSNPAEFEVKRTVVLLDQKVYETTEVVTEQGLYTLLSKRKLIDNAQKIGVLHFGDI